METTIPTPQATTPSAVPPSRGGTKRWANTTARLLQAAAVSVLGLASGCATIVSPTSYKVPILCEPNGANLVVKERDGAVVFKGITPCTVTLDPEYTVFTPARYYFTLSKDGYTSEDWVQSASFNPWYIGNLLSWNVIGFLIVDPLSGAMWKMNGDPVVKRLSPLTPPPPPPPPPPPEIIELTDATLDATIRTGVVFVAFTTPTAPESKTLLKELCAAVGNSATIAWIDLSKNRSNIARYSIKNVPTFILFKDGQSVASPVVGIRPTKFFDDLIRSHIRHSE